MSANGNGDEMTVEEAADSLRDLRDNLGPDAIEEALRTGGGLMGHEANDLQAAIEVLGEQRAAEILGVDVPDGGVPGQQGTLSGGVASGDVSRSRARPAPEGTATLSGFTPDEEDDQGNR